MDLKPIGLRTNIDGNTLLDQVTELALIGGVVVVGAVVAQQLLIGYTAKKASDVAAPVINTIVEVITKPEKVADGAENTAKIVKDALKEPEVQKKVIPPVSDWLNPLIPGPAKPVKIISDVIIDAMTPGSSGSSGSSVDDSPAVDYTPGYDAPYAYNPEDAKDAFSEYFDLEPVPSVDADSGLNIEVDVIEAIDKPKKTGGSSGGGKSIGKATIVVSEDRYKDDLRKSIEKDESYGSSSGDMVKIIFGL